MEIYPDEAWEHTALVLFSNRVCLRVQNTSLEMNNNWEENIDNTSVVNETHL